MSSRRVHVLLSVCSDVYYSHDVQCLQVANMETYNFRPREMLKQVVESILNLSGSPKFIPAVVKSGLATDAGMQATCTDASLSLCRTVVYHSSMLHIIYSLSSLLSVRLQRWPGLAGSFWANCSCSPHNKRPSSPSSVRLCRRRRRGKRRRRKSWER